MAKTFPKITAVALILIIKNQDICKSALSILCSLTRIPTSHDLCSILFNPLMALSLLFFSSLEPNPRNPTPQRKTATNHTQATQCHRQTCPYRIQPHMLRPTPHSMLIHRPTRRNRKQHTSCNWHSSEVVHGSPAEVEIHTAEHDTGEVKER